MDFKDTITVFHVGLVWRANLEPQLCSFGRMERFRNQGQFMNELDSHELETLRSTYLPNTPLTLALRHPSAAVISAPAHFGSRHQRVPYM